MKGELHLIVLWERARYKEKEILEDIQKHLKILECYDIAWNKNNVAENFTRFYGIKLENNSVKEKECGNGSFLLITVWDEHPEYDFAETSRGYEYVNRNIFRLKEKYRTWTNGGHKIHATNSITETNHDITLLLGIGYEDYLKSAPKQWNGKCQKREQDLVGCNGWKSLKELFYTLNNTINYVVLRGLENVETFETSEQHGDIDILAEEYAETVYIINGIPKINVHRPHYEVLVGTKKVLIDIWETGKNYYDKKWEKDILQHKVLQNGFYSPNLENRFYLLIYHSIIHKSRIADDYHQKAEDMFLRLKLDSSVQVKNYPYAFDAYFKLLKEFMYRQHYVFTKPLDKSVYYNETVILSEDIAEYLEQNYFLSNVEPIMINHYGASGYIYFQGYKDEQKLFVKWNGLGDTCKNEFVYTKLFYKMNPDNFIKPWFYKCDGNKKFIAMNYEEGISLEDLIEEKNLTQSQKDIIVMQLGDIAKTLLSCKFVHRDVRPANFILTKDFKLKLIDNQFTVNATKYKETRMIRKNFRIVEGLGCEYAPGKLKWDDLYSIAKMIENIGVSDKTKNVLDTIRANIGKVSICFPKRKYIMARKKAVKLVSGIIPVKSWRKKIRNM